MAEAPRIPRDDRLPPLQAALCGLTLIIVSWGAIFLVWRMFAK